MQSKPHMEYGANVCGQQIEEAYKHKWLDSWKNTFTGRKLYNIQQESIDLNLYSGFSRREVQSFQAHARTGHLIRNEYLKSFDLVDFPYCVHCKKELEALQHIMFTCYEMKSSLKNRVKTNDRNIEKHIFVGDRY